MKAIAQITSRLMESICQLPGVAVLDWCDRAAAAITKAHSPSGAMVAVGQLDRRATVLHLENVGAAWCGETDDAKAIAGTPASPLNLEQARASVAAGDWIGWDLKPLAVNECWVGTMKPVPAVSRRSATGVNKRWDALANCDLIIGAVQLGARHPERVLVIELAMVNCPAEELIRHTTVLEVLLPQIASRYLNAIGAEPADKHNWLTPREETILWKLVSGKKVPQIAGDLHRSIYTVHDHVKSLHRKLGASNRGQLVARALGHLGPLVAEAETGSPDIDDGEDHHPLDPSVNVGLNGGHPAILGSITPNMTINNGPVANNGTH